MQNLANRGSIVVFSPPTERVGHELLHDGLDELHAQLHQPVSELDRSVERPAVGKRTRRVDDLFRLRVHISPTPQRVEILEREAEWIHEPMTP